MNTKSISLYITREYGIKKHIKISKNIMELTTQQKFREALISLLREENLSQAELARKLGISKQHIHNIIKGRRGGTDEIREKIANYFGLTVEEMLEIGTKMGERRGESKSIIDSWSFVFGERLKNLLEYKNMSLKHLAKLTNLPYKTLTNYILGRKEPGLDVIKRITTALNIPVGYFFGEISLEDLSGRKQDLVKEVRFIKPKILYNCPEQIGPVDEDYLAVPLVSEAGAGINGIIPQEEIKSWILVYGPALPARISQNLLAFRIAGKEFSMIPTLHPGDIVLIDRQDFIPEEGGIYLVRLAEPDWPISIKRVNLIKKNNHINIVFSSDNPDKKEYPPMIYDFKEYDEDFNKAIIGRVVWAWSDMTKK